MNRRPHPLDGLRPPPPPAALRDRALSAYPALPPDPDRPTWLDRLWQNRTLRLAWAAAVALLLALHALLPGPGVPAGTTGPPLRASELVAAAGLARWHRTADLASEGLVDPTRRLR